MLLFLNIATSQTLDDSFGVNGKVVTELSTGVDGINEVLLQNDGKIVAIGSANNRIQMARYNNNGSLDTSFGTNGIVNTQLISSLIFNNGGLKFLLQDDGKIVLVGNSASNNIQLMRLMRFTANGQLDTTFGTNGQVNLNSLYQFGDLSSVTNISQTTDGQFQLIISSQLNIIFILKFSNSGVLDTTFGSNGISSITTPQDSSSVYPKDIYSLPNGDNLIASWITLNGQYDFCMFKIKSNGAIDNAFGTNGFVITDLGTSSDYSESITVQPDGKILVGGTANFKYALVRYTSNGNLDTTFNTTGIILTTVGSTSNSTDMYLANDGKIILAGNIVHDFGCVRYNTNGTLDNTFGTNGKYIIDFGGSSYDYGRALVQQTDGKFVFGGMTSFMCSNRAFALTRFSLPNLNVEIPEMNLLKVYPNPTNSIVNIKSDFTINSIEVYDMQGRNLETNLVNQTETTIDISTKSNGVYFLKIATGNGFRIEKIIKQ